MNKIVKTLCMIAVVALAFTSCKKEENQAKSFAFNGTAEQFMEVNENGDFERMYIDDKYNTFFEEGDEFVMYCIYDDPYMSVSNSAEFRLEEGVLVKMNENANISYSMQYPGNYYSFYPRQAAKGCWFAPDEVGSVTGKFMARFELPTTLTYRTHESGFVQMPWEGVMMAAKEEQHSQLNQCAFYYKNIMGAMSLKLYSPEGQTVKSIKVKDNRFNLAGRVIVNVAEADPVYLTTLIRNYDESNTTYMAELQNYLTNELAVSYEGDLRHEVTLDCGAGVELGTTAATATRFLIPLRPLALMNGCQVVITFDDNSTKTLETTTDHRMLPNVIMNFNPINVD